MDSSHIKRDRNNTVVQELYREGARRAGYGGQLMHIPTDMILPLWACKVWWARYGVLIHPPKRWCHPTPPIYTRWIPPRS